MALIDHRPRMTPAEFHVWHEAQSEKWELVDGEPVLRSVVRGMAGGQRRHGLIAANVISALRPRLRGGPCAPLSSDVRIVTGDGGVRYPNVTVDCGRAGPDALEAAEPRLLFEVLSPSNRVRHLFALLDAYQATAAVQEIVFVSQEEASASVWRRGPTGWTRTEVLGADAEITLESVGVTLPMAEIYEGVE